MSAEVTAKTTSLTENIAGLGRSFARYKVPKPNQYLTQAGERPTNTDLMQI